MKPRDVFGTCAMYAGHDRRACAMGVAGRGRRGLRTNGSKSEPEVARMHAPQVNPSLHPPCRIGVEASSRRWRTLALASPACLRLHRRHLHRHLQRRPLLQVLRPPLGAPGSALSRHQPLYCVTAVAETVADGWTEGRAAVRLPSQPPRSRLAIAKWRVECRRAEGGIDGKRGPGHTSFTHSTIDDKQGGAVHDMSPTPRVGAARVWEPVSVLPA